MLNAAMATSGKNRYFRIVLPFIFCVSVSLFKFQIAVASVFPCLVVIDHETYDESVADKIQLHGIDRALSLIHIW